MPDEKDERDGTKVGIVGDVDEPDARSEERRRQRARLDAAIREAAARVQAREQKLEEEDPWDVEDIVVVRDEDGRVEPIKVTTLLDEIVIRIRPLLYGDKKRYPFDELDARDFSDDDKARLIREHVVEPDLSEHAQDGEALRRNFDYATVDTIVTSIALYSRSKFRRLLPKLKRMQAEGKEPTREDATVDLD